MRKRWVAALGAACVLLLGVNIVIAGKMDREPPEIHFPDQEVVYIEGAGYDTLLEGVTAEDSRDGDVTDSLLVENVHKNADGVTGTAVYAAMDHSKNVEKKTRTIKIQGSEEEPVEAVPSPEPENSVTPEATQEPEHQEAEQPETVPEKEEEEILPEGSPRITLSESELTVKQGEEVDRLSYVEDITDDKDDSKKLWRQIRITGDQLDTDTPGVYRLLYHVTDSDGNRSNEAVLQVTVEEE